MSSPCCQRLRADSWTVALALHLVVVVALASHSRPISDSGRRWTLDSCVVLEASSGMDLCETIQVLPQLDFAETVDWFDDGGIEQSSSTSPHAPRSREETANRGLTAQLAVDKHRVRFGDTLTFTLTVTNHTSRPISVNLGVSTAEFVMGAGFRLVEDNESRLAKSRPWGCGFSRDFIVTVHAYDQIRLHCRADVLGTHHLNEPLDLSSRRFMPGPHFAFRSASLPIDFEKKTHRLSFAQSFVVHRFRRPATTTPDAWIELEAARRDERDPIFRRHRYTWQPDAPLFVGDLATNEVEIRLE